MLKKQFFILILIVLFFSKSFCATNPLEKITITSNRATCQKDIPTKNMIQFDYIENVLVTFADDSIIKSDNLEILIDTQKAKEKLDTNLTNTNEQKENKLSQFKKITFKDNVYIKRENRTINTDKAELYLDEKLCKLFGNIKIVQNKEKPKDLPIVTECNQAILNMQTEQITFLGDSRKPVSTTIELAGHPGLMKKVKTKEEKQAERKALREQKLQAKRKRL